MFALIPGPLGALAMLRGVVRATFFDTGSVPTTPIAGLGEVVYNSDDAITADKGRYAVIPFSEWVRVPELASFVGARGQNTGSLSVDKYRIIANRADVTFTGSTFGDGGSVAIGRQVISVGRENPPNGAQGAQIPQATVIQFLNAPPPLSFAEVSVIAGAQVMSARNTFCLNNPPPNFDWSEWMYGAQPVLPNVSGDSSVTDFDTYFGQGYSYGAIGSKHVSQGPMPGFGHGVCTFVAYNGLQIQGEGGAGGASITIQAGTCVEYTVAFNSVMRHMAKEAPPTDPAAIRRVQDVGRKVPPAVVQPAPGASGGVMGALEDYWGLQKKAMGLAWGFGADVLRGITGGNINLPIGSGYEPGSLQYGGGRARPAIRNR